MWPKSNNITAFALDLKSAYEGKHKIFGLLSLANLAQDDPFWLLNTCCYYIALFYFLNLRLLTQQTQISIL
jgi:hypothetical protein